MEPGPPPPSPPHTRARYVVTLLVGIALMGVAGGLDFASLVLVNPPQTVDDASFAADLSAVVGE